MDRFNIDQETALGLASWYYKNLSDILPPVLYSERTQNEAWEFYIQPALPEWMSKYQLEITQAIEPFWSYKSKLTSGEHSDIEDEDQQHHQRDYKAEALGKGSYGLVLQFEDGIVGKYCTIASKQIFGLIREVCITLATGMYMQIEYQKPLFKNQQTYYIYTLLMPEIKKYTSRQIPSNLFQDLLTEVNTLHKKGIAHCDLTERNVILGNEKWHIIDYGKSIQLDFDEQIFSSENERDLPNGTGINQYSYHLLQSFNPDLSSPDILKSLDFACITICFMHKITQENNCIENTLIKAGAFKNINQAIHAILAVLFGMILIYKETQHTQTIKKRITSFHDFFMSHYQTHYKNALRQACSALDHSDKQPDFVVIIFLLVELDMYVEHTTNCWDIFCCFTSNQLEDDTLGTDREPLVKKQFTSSSL